MFRNSDYKYCDINYSILIFSGLMCIILFMIINLKFYTINMFILSLPFQITNCVYAATFLMDTLAFSGIVPLLAYYEHLRINKINRQINKVNNKSVSHVVVKTVTLFTEEHNRYCTHIEGINQFWKIPFLIFMVTAFPFNLTMMHQLLFESIPIEICLIYAFAILIHGSILFGVQYCFALLSIKIHSMYAKLSRLQWCLKRQQMSVKLKLIICFDRLVSKKKIGITFGSVVFVMPLFTKVNIQ